MSMDSLRDVFIDELRDLYSAENQIVKALPRLAKAASTPELGQALRDHLEETRGQIERLDQIFDSIGGTAGRKKCVGMEGLIEEGKELLEKKKQADPAALDAALIGAAQKVEHYEMAAYGTARTHARILGLKEAARLLQQTLDEEGEADKRLTALAERGINEEAAESGTGEEEEGTGRGGRRTHGAGGQFSL